MFSQTTDPKQVAQDLAQMGFTINATSQGEFSPEHVKYHCTLQSGYHTFNTAYESNPSVHGTPTVADVFSALVSDALTAQDYTLDEFAGEFDFEKPSQLIRAYEGCKKSLDWLRDDLYISSTDLGTLSGTLEEHLKTIKADVETTRQAQAEQDALVNPPVPDGFVTLAEMEADLDLGEYGDQCPEYATEYISDTFSEVADSNVDIYNAALLQWLPDNYEWLEEAEAQGLLEGTKGDIFKMIRAAQYECFLQDMHDHKEDICKYAALEELKDAGVYAISTDLADSLFDDVDFDAVDRFSDITIDVEQAIQFAYEEGMEHAAPDLDLDTIDYDTVNPAAMTVKAVRSVNEQGYDTAFAVCWKDAMEPEERGDATPSLGDAAKESRASQSALKQAAGRDDGHDATKSEQPKDTNR